MSKILKVWNYKKYITTLISLYKWYQLAKASVKDKQISKVEWDALQNSMYVIITNVQE